MLQALQEATHAEEFEEEGLWETTQTREDGAIETNS